MGWSHPTSTQTDYIQDRIDCQTRADQMHPLNKIVIYKGSTQQPAKKIPQVTTPSGPGVFGRDGEETPIVRREPKYPVQITHDGKEGWVQLSFTINELGGVEDVKVIAAEPKRIFDREAKRALHKWKYKPKIVNGKTFNKDDKSLDHKLIFILCLKSRGYELV